MRRWAAGALLFAAVSGGWSTAEVASAASVSTIRLTVADGGPGENWRVRESRPLCALGYTRSGEWSVRYAIPAASGARTLTDFELFVPGDQDAPTGARQFGLAIVVGPAVHPVRRYDVETRAASRRRQGAGVVTVADRGDTATVTFEARTATGIALRGSVDCGQVDRALRPDPTAPAASADLLQAAQGHLAVARAERR